MRASSLARLVTTAKHSFPSSPPSVTFSTIQSHYIYKQPQTRKFQIFGLIAAATAVTVTTAIATTNTADAASSNLPTVPLPTIPLPPVASPTTSNSSPRASTRSATKAKPLPNPGKFDTVHREAENITSIHVVNGAQLQYAMQLFPPSAPGSPLKSDKQVTLAPIVSTENGGYSILNVRTELGTAHVLTGVILSNGLVTGKYKYNNGPWTIKPEFRVAPQQEMINLEIDYKASDYVAQFSLVNFQEATLSYHQSVTPTIALGVQLLSVYPMVNFFNYSARYNNGVGDIASISRKNGAITLSYFRKIWEAVVIPQAPPLSLTMATSLKVLESNGQSEWVVGLSHHRQFFRYTASLSSTWTAAVSLEQNLLGLNSMFQVTGEMKFDGSQESKFGVGINVG